MNSRKFDADIYPQKAIEQSILDFNELCRVETEISDNYIICRFFDCKYDVKTTIDEFSNYIIDLINSKSKIW